MSYYALIPLLSSFVLIGFATYVLALQSNRLVNLFLAFNASLVIWNVGEFFNWVVLPDYLVNYNMKTLSVSWLLMGFLCLQFMYQMINRKPDWQLKIFLGLACVAIIIAIPTDLFVNGFHYTGWSKVASPGILYLPFLFLLVVAPVVYGISLIIHTLQQEKATDAERKSMKLFLYGISISVTIAVLSDMIIPHVFGFKDALQIGSCSAVIFCYFMLMAVNRHKFLQISTEDLGEDLFMDSSEAIVLLNCNGVLQKVNPAAVKLLNLQNIDFKACDLGVYLLNYSSLEEYAGFETTTASGRSIILNQSKIKNSIGGCKGYLLLINDLTEKKEAQNKLLEINSRLESEVLKRTAELSTTRDFLESIFNTITDAIVIVNSHGVIVKCNKQFYKFFHYQSADFQDKIVDMLFSDDELINFKEKLYDLKQRGHFTIESSVVLENGEENPATISTSILKSDLGSGMEDCLLVVISDISQRKKAESKLLDSERIARMIIENIAETILVVQDGLVKYFVNQKFTGHTFDEVKDQPFDNYIHPDFREIVRNNYHDRQSGRVGVPSTYQIKIIDTKGVYLWTEVNIVDTKWKKRDAILVYLRDISKQKEAEEKLVENEKLFRAFIDQANDFILIKGRDGSYIKINKKFSWLIGKSEAEISGKTPRDLGYSETFINEVELLDRQIIQNKITNVRESEARKSKKAGLEWLEETMFPILDDDGEVKYIGVISRDISETKKNEEELFKQNNQLQEAYKKLQESYEIIINQEKLASLGTMAAGMAHEINNPSQAIKFSMQSLKFNIIDLKTFLDICKKTKDDQNSQNGSIIREIAESMDRLDLDTVLNELQQIADDNEKSVERIHNIIQSTSRLSYHDQEMKPCDIKQIVNDALTLLHNNIKHQTRVEKSFAHNLPAVMGIHQQLEQVIINLINNARDAMQEKGLNLNNALLAIQLGYNSKNGMVEIKISDNGNGIPENVINKIYDPFFTTKQLGKGTGLGLNLVHRIISSHKGSISVYSKIGEGTTFTVKLPAA